MIIKSELIAEMQTYCVENNMMDRLAYLHENGFGKPI